MEWVVLRRKTTPTSPDYFLLTTLLHLSLSSTPFHHCLFLRPPPPLLTSTSVGTLQKGCDLLDGVVGPVPPTGIVPCTIRTWMYKGLLLFITTPAQNNNGYSENFIVIPTHSKFAPVIHSELCNPVKSCTSASIKKDDEGKSGVK